MSARGACIISIDYEYAWGYADTSLVPADLERIRGEVEITRRLVELFEHHHVPATWAIVARLLTVGEHGEDIAWHDTGSLIHRIRDSFVGHEVASHSFGHVLFDGIDASGAETDVSTAKRLHLHHELPFKSFVFPRNKEGHHAVLTKHGMVSFRGMSSTWYEKLPYRLWTLGRGVDYWLPTARTVVPSVHESGLINIPDSLLFVSRRGIQRLLPARQTIRKIVRGLRAAAERGEVFHLWFHPSNFSWDTETQFAIFDAVLREAGALRDEGLLDIVTMGEYADSFKRNRHD